MLLGQSVARREGRSKVTGAAQYVDDFSLPGMLHGATVRSSAPRGFIKGITFDPIIPWSEFVVVTARDIPGANRIALILDDQPCLAGDGSITLKSPCFSWLIPIVRCSSGPVVTSRSTSSPNRPSSRSTTRSTSERWCGAPTTSSRRYVVARGDIDAAFAAAEIVVEGEYETGAQEQLYIEPNGMVATASPDAGVTVWGSMQCPYYIHKALRTLFNLPADKVRVVQMETGGGFGGKEEYPSMIACHAALLAWKSGTP